MGWPLLVDHYVMLQDADSTTWHADVFPVLSFNRVAPETNGKPLHWKFRDGALGITSHTASVAARCLSNARVLDPAGTIINKEGKLVYDASEEICLTPDTHSVFNRVIYKRPLVLKGLGLNISASQSHENYFHWMTDAIPKLGIATAAGYELRQFDYFIVNSRSQHFQQETLRLLDLPNEKIIALDEHPYLLCENLLVTTATCLSGNVSPGIIQFLRDSFLPHKASTQTPERILVARKNAVRRKLLNESALSLGLKEFGFETVYLEDCSFQEQMALFANAKIIIASHGAGLTNVAFCTAGTHVLELFPPTYVNQGFWTMSSNNGLVYSYLIGEGEEVPNNHDLLRNIDFTISMTEVIQFLKRFDQF